MSNEWETVCQQHTSVREELIVVQYVLVGEK